MSFAEEYEKVVHMVHLTDADYTGPGHPRIGDELAIFIAESKSDGFEAIHSFYDDTCDEYEVLLVKKIEKDSI